MFASIFNTSVRAGGTRTLIVRCVGRSSTSNIIQETIPRVRKAIGGETGNCISVLYTPINDTLLPTSERMSSQKTQFATRGVGMANHATSESSAPLGNLRDGEVLGLSD